MALSAVQYFSAEMIIDSPDTVEGVCPDDVIFRCKEELPKLVEIVAMNLWMLIMKVICLKRERRRFCLLATEHDRLESRPVLGLTVYFVYLRNLAGKFPNHAI